MSEAYVIDASALMQVYIEDVFTDNAVALISGLTDDDPLQLHFLESRMAEATNVLWKHVRQGNIDRAAAESAVTDLQAMWLIVHPVSVFLDDALTIGLDHNLAVYDALYIALARYLDLPLVTAAAQAAGVTVTPLTDFTSAS